MCALVHKDITSRAFKEAAERKAKKVHFYQNGRPYAAKLTVSMIPGKDFHSFEQLCQFLTDKSQLLNGVQYIFTTNGRRVVTMAELEHGQSYVISGSKNFWPHPYGIVKLQAPRISKISNRYKFVREDDLRLLRPLSSKYNNVYANANHVTVPHSNGDNRIVTIVNNQDHAISCKVILNLKTPKSFDNLLRDLGQAVRMNLPRRMFASSGLEVKSVSHLKHDLSHIDLFYIDSERSNEHFKLLTKYPSLESIEKFMENSVRRLNQLSSHSSNIDIRPHNVAFNSSLSSNLEVGRHWQANEVNIYPIEKVTRKKSNPPQLKATQANNNKHKTIQSKEKDTAQNEALCELRTDKELRKRSISKEREGMVMDQVNSEFSIDNVSALKYDQIQRYAERILQEASSQIKSEHLLENVNLNDNQTRSSKQSAVQVSRVKSTRKVPQSSLRKSNTETAKKVSLKESKPDKVKDKNSSSADDALQLATIIAQEVPIVKSSVTSLNQPPPMENNAQKLNTKSPSKSKLTGNSVNSVASTNRPSHSRKSTSTVKSNSSLGKNCQSESASSSTNAKANVPLHKDKMQISEGRKVSNEMIVAKSEKYLRKGTNIPNYVMNLTRIFGYNGENAKNLLYLNTGELAYTSGVFAILWNPATNTQRFYKEHDDDIYCMRLDNKSQFIATSQVLNASQISVIRVWSIKNLSTLCVLKDKALNLSITDMEFTLNNSLFVVNCNTKLLISLWNWNASRMIASASKQLDKDELVFGGTVHPLENDIMVTYGKMHLVVWHLHKDKTIDYRTALQTHSKISKIIYCADFLGDNSLLTGDSTGNLTIWAPFEVNNVLEFAIKEVKGHETQLTSLKLTSDHILISGDKEGTIKTWDVSDGEFRMLNAIKLPSVSGSVCAFALPSENNQNLDIFVGTSENFILKGSALQSTSYEIVLEGHTMAIRTISFDPSQDLFYTASLDQKVCKWSAHSLIWRSSIEVQAISSTVHPTGQVLAIGSVNGIISIIACASGEILQHLEISSVCIGCMSYSADGSFLVAGCQDGNLHVLPANDNGYSYSKVSVLKGPLPILTLQWSMDTQFILTSVDDNNYQELILWDLHNTRYIRNVTNFSDNLRWYNATCSGLEDARGTWDNRNLQNVINICSHYSPSLKYILTGDEAGYIRLFSYPCFQTDVAFYQYLQGGGSVTDIKVSPKETFVVTCNFQGSILLWTLINVNDSIKS